MKSKEPELVFFDALRGLAALVVFLGHARFFLANISLAQAIISANFLVIIAAFLLRLTVFGHQAVILFVFLSGFWVTYSQVLKPLDRKGFVKRRLSKVYLPYICALLFSVAVDLLGSSLAPEFYSRLVINANAFFSTLFLYGALYTGFGSNIPLITVALIIFCYLIYALLGKRIVLGFVIGLAGLAAYFLTLEPILLVLVYWIVWLMGSAVSRAYLSRKELTVRFSFVRHKAFAGIPKLIYFLSFLFVLYVLYKNYFLVNLWYGDIIEDVVLGVATSFLAFGLLNSKKLLFALPKFFNKLSDYSYSLYLIHYPIIVIIFALFSSGPAQFFSSIVLVTIVTLLFDRVTKYFSSLGSAPKAAPSPTPAKLKSSKTRKNKN